MRKNTQLKANNEVSLLSKDLHLSCFMTGYSVTLQGKTHQQNPSDFPCNIKPVLTRANENGHEGENERK